MTTHALRQFVEDELLRAPMVIDMTMQEVFQTLQREPGGRGAAERQVASEVILRLGAHRAFVAAGYIKSLRQQAADELGGATSRPAGAVNHPAVGKGLEGLALVDDEDVAVDVAISYTTEAIKSVAETELRELLSFTSALVNDMDVTRDHNPLRAEAQAHALWFAAQGLPMSRTHQLAFMRMAAMPFAQALRKNYAAASARLEEQGVEPAAYRTLILPRGPRRDRSLAGGFGPSGSGAGAGAFAQRSLEERADVATPYTTATLRQPSAASPVAASREPAVHQRAADTQVTTPAVADSYTAGAVDQLFETMLTDRRLPAELQAPFLRLQVCATKAAMLDESVLEVFTHPLWRFIDLLANEASIHPGANGIARQQLITFANKLTDKLLQETRHGEQLYSWAIERLDRYVAKRLAERLALNEAMVSTMQTLEDRLAADSPLSTMHGAIDVEQLDTVPSDLMDGNLQSEAPDRAMTSSRWLLERRSGDWLRLFRKGQWSYAQLLWPGDRGEIFLFGDGHSDDVWAIRRSALLALRDSKLARMAWPRSLVTDASAILMRKARRHAH